LRPLNDSTISVDDAPHSGSPTHEVVEFAQILGDFCLVGLDSSNFPLLFNFSGLYKFLRGFHRFFAAMFFVCLLINSPTGFPPLVCILFCIDFRRARFSEFLTRSRVLAQEQSLLWMRVFLSPMYSVV